MDQIFGVLHLPCTRHFSRVHKNNALEDGNDPSIKENAKFFKEKRRTRLQKTIRTRFEEDNEFLNQGNIKFFQQKRMNEKNLASRTDKGGI